MRVSDELSEEQVREGPVSLCQMLCCYDMCVFNVYNQATTYPVTCLGHVRVLYTLAILVYSIYGVYRNRFSVPSDGSVRDDGL